MSGSRNTVDFGQTRVTSSSLPPPTQFHANGSGLFWGDYTGLATVDNTGHPIWSDTRPKDVFLCLGTATGPGKPPELCSAKAAGCITANDEDIYTAQVEIPVP